MKEVLFSKDAPVPIGPYSQAIKTGNLIFLSGQIGINPSTGSLFTTLEEQFHQIMKNIQAILKISNASLDSIIKTTIFITNMSEFPQINDLYKQYFTSSFPARSTVEVSKLPKSALIEIEAIAWAP
ncbi:MAG: hypothetical protein A2Y62_02425 [Candidatus Fischerbacteria bacterium RBG_13_37_8]|uniref:Reactive intermediate/imine deaminase n=1 Tax=Candidatus Fischerbacteria bacterium RBG_13_37_8 TaxID=1817863 RepID=A0A1F5VHW7_9BACT|nr:MAG: hypothetical protein A2Y62_02425 [Candidatus Fischerbacteria bacterium RBG_13_37_8]